LPIGEQLDGGRQTSFLSSLLVVVPVEGRAATCRARARVGKMTLSETMLAIGVGSKDM
jgi:hypothetical protein